MKKLMPVFVLVVAVIAIVVIRKPGTGSDVEPLVWYGMMPHPYISEVQIGAEAASTVLDMPILLSVGQEWTQDNESANIKAMSTRGHKAFSRNSRRSLMTDDPVNISKYVYTGNALPRSIHDGSP